jgi:hypothetical protein
MQNTNKFIFIIPVLTVLLFLFSCTAQPSITEPALTLTNRPLPQITSTALSLPTSIVTSLTITPMPTLKAVWTFPPENAYLELEDLLKNGCELPCWADITPGVTFLADASKTLLPFSGISNWNSVTETGGQLSLNYPKDGLSIGLFIQLLSSKEEDRVQLLSIFTQALREIKRGSYQSIYEAQPYHELLRAYSMQNVMATYGKPSEIYVTVEINDAEYDAPDFVMWWLMYPEKGFIAKYTANAEVVDAMVHGCPSKTFVELWLFSPYSNDEYKVDLPPFDMTLEYILPIPSIRTKPISYGIEMTIDQFYQVFSQPTNQCLETPRSKCPEF